MPPELRSAGKVTVTAAEGDGPSLARFEGVAYTGAVMQPEGWWGSIICDLDGIRVPKDQRPVLRQHDHQKIVGHADTVTVGPAGVRMAGVLSNPDSEHAQEIVRLAKNGFQWQLSIGATPVRTEFLEAGQTATVNGREVQGPLSISRETELGEISFVPLGADGDTSVTVTASRRSAMNRIKAALAQIAAGKYSADEIDKMSEEEAKAALKNAMDDEPDGDETKAKAEDDKEKAEADDDTDKTEADDDAPAKSAKSAAQKRIRAARKAEADEARRCDGIRALARKYDVSGFKAHGKPASFVAHAIEAGWSADHAELQALRLERPQTHIHIGSDPEMSEAVLECAVFQAASPTDFRLFDDSFYTADGVKGRGAVPAHIAARTKRELAARYSDKVQQAAHDRFKGRISLQRLFAEVARGNGFRGRDLDWNGGDGADALRFAAGQAGFRADGASNYSLSNVLANVLGKSMLGGYLFVEQAWREVSGVRSVVDFKQTKAINLFGTDIMYDAVGPTGELKNASLRDQAFTNQADQYGKIMTIDRKAIINDDLGALTTVPMLLGRGAALRLNNNFWTVFLNPGNDNGGSTAFWAATHTITGESANGNYISGATTALSSTALQTAKQTFDKQVDPAGFPLGVEAEILLYPPELDQVAWELMNSAFLVMSGSGNTTASARQPSANRWAGKYRPVMSRYLSNTAFTGYSTTAWYLLANPGFLPVIEAVFLNGVDVPTVQQAGIDFQFDRLGISIRGVFDFGVNAQNFRGGVKSAGA